MTDMEEHVESICTDKYQINMIYCAWKERRHNSMAVFELYYRQNPFNSAYAIFAGLEKCLKFVQEFKFRPEEIKYIRHTVLPDSVEEDFLDYLRSFSCGEAEIWAIDEGTVVFPYIPLITVRAPYCVGQLIESVLINCVDYSSLVVTNASRYRLLVGPDKMLSDFCLRRAPGIQTALTASKYSYIGGVDSTSNLLAGFKYGIPISGTISHSFITSFSVGEIDHLPGIISLADCDDFIGQLEEIFSEKDCSPNRGELVSFICYANAYPDSFVALLDTYDTMKSGFVNFAAVALALNKGGHKALGVRIDSGDLAYQSKQIRLMMRKVGDRFNLDWFGGIRIIVSNQLSVEIIQSLLNQPSEIDGFGIGSGLVGSSNWQNMGCVYKLVEIEGSPCSKVFHPETKAVFPYRKSVYRIYGTNNFALVDYLCEFGEDPPIPGTKIMCNHSTDSYKRMIVVPTVVRSLQRLYFSKGKIVVPLPTIEEIRSRVCDELSHIRSDHLRLKNPTPYKISFSDKLNEDTKKYFHARTVVRQYN